jgi:tripeptide aminopeptidase
MDIRGDSGTASVGVILRDFTTEGMNRRIQRMRSLQGYLSEKHERARIELAITDQYKNPKELLAEDGRVVECAMKGTLMAGITPRETGIRGGTDGSRLSYMGVPTVNLPTGGGLFHSRREWAAVEGMEKALEILMTTIIVWGETMG